MHSGFFHVETVVRKIKYFPVFVKPSLKAGLFVKIMFWFLVEMMTVF